MQTEEYRLTHKQTNMQTNVIIKQKITKIRDNLEIASEKMKTVKRHKIKTINRIIVLKIYPIVILYLSTSVQK